MATMARPAEVRNLATLIAASARLATEVLKPAANSVDQSRSFPRHALSELGKEGVLGLMVPVEFGGTGAGLSEMVTVLETLAQGCSSTAMVVLMHYCATAVLSARGPAALKESVLPAVARGEHLSTLAFSELGSGGHFYFPVSQAQREDSNVRISAFKSFVTSAGEADSYIVSTRNPEAGSAQESDLYFAPGSTAGIEIVNKFEGLGLAGNASAAMRLSEVRVSSDNRLGPEKSGFNTMLEVVLPHFQIGSAAVSLGIARAAFELATEHVLGRKYEHVRNSSLADIPRVQFLIAEMAIELRSGRAYLLETVRKAIVREADAMVDVLAVKAKSAEVSLAVASRSMTLGGGRAFGQRGGLERLFRDAQASAVMAPGTDVLKEFIGKAVLGLPLFG